MTGRSAPSGYVPFAHPSPYLELIGPLYEADDDPTRVALYLDQRHTNSRGMLHAGVLVAVADVIMGHTARRAAVEGTRLVTVSLSTDFPRPATPGAWAHGVAAAHRVGRRLAFANAEFSVADRVILTARGVFAVASPAPDAHTDATHQD